MLRSAEISYRSNKPANAKSSKEFWWLVKSFQGNNKCSTIGPVKSPSNSLLTNNLSKANEFNSYFVNICSTLVNTDNSSALDLSTQPVNHIHRITSTLQSFPVNKELLSYCFKNYIKVGKACGKRLAKNCKRWVVFIHNFLNFAKKNFDDCMFPSQWKTAQVHYIHKREVLETVEITVLFHFWVYQVSYRKVLHAFI